MACTLRPALAVVAPLAAVVVPLAVAPVAVAALPNYLLSFSLCLSSGLRSVAFETNS